MKLFRGSLLQWLLLATFFKGVVFAAIIPLWHGPDEQAHFAQVQYLAEHKRLIPRDNQQLTTSQEILLSERFLGTERDGLGKNKFTHNPSFRIEYTDSIIGKYEQTIRNLTKASRVTLVIKEATEYPPSYYAISALFYQAAYPLDLFNRVFIVRFASIFMGVGTVWLAFKIMMAISSKRVLYAVTVGAIIAFQPMFSFLSSTVNSDNLMNLVFTGFLLLGVKSNSGNQNDFQNDSNVYISHIDWYFDQTPFRNSISDFDQLTRFYEQSTTLFY